MSYAPYQPSRLASSPSLSLHPPPGPSSSDLLSSPTTASFYNPTPSNVSSSLTRNTSRPRLYKSQSSNRTSSARNLSLNNSSSPSTSNVQNPFRSIHEKARLQRTKQARPQRDLSRTGLVPDEPGGWTREGEWEEFDDYERERLEFEMMRERKEYKWQMKVKNEQASDALLDPDDESGSDYEGEMHEEPPLDILSDYEPLLPSPHDPFSTRLPSLASSISSSPYLHPTSNAPSPMSDLEDASMSNPLASMNLAPSIQAFEDTLLAAACPGCGQESRIAGDETGAKCLNCEWGISAEILKPLELAFARHGDAESGHIPLFSHTLFTGTLVFCRACDEQFAA